MTEGRQADFGEQYHVRSEREVFGVGGPRFLRSLVGGPRRLRVFRHGSRLSGSWVESGPDPGVGVRGVSCDYRWVISVHLADGDEAVLCWRRASGG